MLMKRTLCRISLNCKKMNVLFLLLCKIILINVELKNISFVFNCFIAFKMFVYRYFAKCMLIVEDLENTVMILKENNLSLTDFTIENHCIKTLSKKNWLEFI